MGTRVDKLSASHRRLRQLCGEYPLWGKKDANHEGGSSGHWYGTNFSSFGGRYGLAEEGFPFSCELMQYYDSH